MPGLPEANAVGRQPHGAPLKRDLLGMWHPSHDAVLFVTAWQRPKVVRLPYPALIHWYRCAVKTSQNDITSSTLCTYGCARSWRIHCREPCNHLPSRRLGIRYCLLPKALSQWLNSAMLWLYLSHGLLIVTVRSQPVPSRTSKHVWSKRTEVWVVLASSMETLRKDGKRNYDKLRR